MLFRSLDRDGEEELVIRTDAVDCLTFVEYTLAQALGSSFTENLQKIRYRDGIIDGYPSRLHYTSDWASGVSSRKLAFAISCAPSKAGNKHEARRKCLTRFIIRYFFSETFGQHVYLSTIYYC